MFSWPLFSRKNIIITLPLFPWEYGQPRITAAKGQQRNLWKKSRFRKLRMKCMTCFSSKQECIVCILFFFEEGVLICLKSAGDLDLLMSTSSPLSCLNYRLNMLTVHQAEANLLTNYHETDTRFKSFNAFILLSAAYPLPVSCYFSSLVSFYWRLSSSSSFNIGSRKWSTTWTNAEFCCKIWQ